MKRVPGVHLRGLAPLLGVVFALGAGSVQAASESLGVTQAADSTITVTLAGTRDCSGSPDVLAPTTVSVLGTSVSIISPLGPVLGVICPAGSPIFVYSRSANLGVLANGNYAVAWSFVPPAMPAQSTSFAIAGGALVMPPVPGVPSLSLPAEALLAALVLGFAVLARRPPFRP
jgi:hypothetical protein